MKIIIVCKSAFCWQSVEAGETKTVPIIMAGHTVQLIRPLVKVLLSQGSQCALVCPKNVGPEEAELVDLDDELPDGLVLEQFAANQIPKSNFNSAHFEFTHALLRAAEKIGSPDLVLFINSFPILLFAKLGIDTLQRKYGSRPMIGVMLRGGDGYKWTSRAFLESYFKNKDIGVWFQQEYVDTLNYADYVATSSRWLKAEMTSVGVHVDGVVPSPPIEHSLVSQDVSKARIAKTLVRGFPMLSLEKRWIVSSGRFHADKRPDLAIRGFLAANDKSSQLVFAGAGNIRTIQKVTSKLRESERNLISVVEVPPRLLPELYNSMDVCLHSSLPSNNFIDSRPSAVTSAAYHRKPVVAFDGGGVSECVSKENFSELCIKACSTDSTSQIVDKLASRLTIAIDKKRTARMSDANWEQTKDITIEKLQVSLNEMVLKYNRAAKGD